MRGIKKSRQGCATCKSKRLKCDESRPACGRCTRLRIKCPGYAQPFRWVTKHEVFQAAGSNDTAAAVAGEFSPDRTSPADSGPPLFEASDSILPAESPLVSTSPAGELNGAAGSLNNDWQQSLDIEDLDRQLSTSLPDLAHLNTPFVDRDRQSAHRLSLSSESSQLQSSNGLPFSARRPTGHLSQPTQSVGRLPPTNLQSRSAQSSRPAVPARTLEDPSSTLVEYYFKEVAGLFSSYDSHMNPFRTTVSRLWTSSPAMCRTLQSMAAATLVDDFPQFGPLGLRMRKEAIAILESQDIHDDKSLLAMLMLGQTASWHDPNDLGISYFNRLRNYLNSIKSDTTGGSLLTNRNNQQFFEEALIYWEMLLSYVADDETLNLSVTAAEPSHPSSDQLLTQKVPHPWTGIARDTQFIVNRVGRLVRRERTRIRARQFTSQRGIAQAQEAIHEARELEQKLLYLAHPIETDIVNPGDADTPVWHLTTMAEVYRQTGLLQLYRCFPDLLSDRENVVESTNTSEPSRDLHLDTFQPSDAAQFPDDENYDIFNSFPTFATDQAEMNELSDDERSEHLTTMALTAIDRLRSIPLESRTRCLQPFLLVASSSELRLPAMESPVLDPDRNDYSLNLSGRAIEVSRARRFILGRLTSFLHVLPPKPIRLCVKLVQEVWRRMDEGEMDVYWIDVMIDNGWETTMG